MRALITGDQGFLGRHFKAELKERGYEVYGCDIAVTRSQDCRNLFDLERRIAQQGNPAPRWDLVVHCAAVIGGREVIENSPLETADSLSIDAQMFRWAAVVKPGRVLYFSSSAAYPVGFQTHHAAGSGYRLHEEDIWGDDGMRDPDEIYGWSKVTGEVLAGRLRAAGVPVTVVRPFSGYGGDQSADYPFRAILERVRRQDDPLDVWCAGCVRDWVHVDDIVAGALAVVADGTEAPVNICTGRGTSFRMLAEEMAQQAGYHPHIREVPGKPQGVRHRVGNPNRFFNIYRPKITIEEGIRLALG